MSARSPGGRILLISDDLEANNIWAYLLSQRGLEVVSVELGDRVIEEFIKDPFDLVVINCYSDPSEVLTWSCRLRSEMVNPLLLMVSTQDEGFLLDAYGTGIDDCIVKPISHRLFVTKISAWLRRSWTIPTEALN